MLQMIAAPEAAGLATRLKNDLQATGYVVNDDLPPGREHLLIVVLSPAAWANPTVQATAIRALDNSQHIIPVLTDGASLPKLIAHLTALDFTTDYSFEALKQLVDRLSAPDAPPPLRVLTPAVRGANRRIGYWLFILVLIWFIVGVILVGVFRVQAPTEEYNSIATFAQATINVYVGRNLPRSTEDAINFPMTLQAAPTAQRPLLIATATRLAGGNSATATPTPS